MIKIENETFTKGYVGLSEIRKIYKGQTVVYEKSTPTQKVGVKFSTINGGTCDIGVTVNAGATAPTLQYSFNDDNTWYNWDGSSKPIDSTNVLWVRGTNGAVNNEWCFTITTSQDQFQGVKVSGDVNALLNEVGGQIADFPTNAFQGLFYECQHLVDASELELPQRTLNEYCYSNMFEGCASLTTAPALPATTLASYCYYWMFNRCTSLTAAPALPATTMAEYCYESMFSVCASLTAAPALPATTLAAYCYSNMFFGCASLTAAPALPATILTTYCYSNMFNECTSLTTAPTLPATTLASYCYYYMFSGCTSLVNAPQISATTLTDNCCGYMFRECTSLTTAPTLPATTLADSCYDHMFYNCTSLTTAPTLPATTLASYCYNYMFINCTSLSTAPTLPATTLETYCYAGMFRGCTSLTTAPALPATTLASYCYYYMFYGCTSLTAAPALPATTLASYCYSYMFSSCTSLATAPALPATTLATWCYSNMFRGCASLTTAPALPATTLASGCYANMFNRCSSLGYIEVYFDDWGTDNTTSWLYLVAATGTFKKYPSLPTTRGQSYIPTGWTIEEMVKNTFEIDGTGYDYDHGLAYMNAHGGHVKLLEDLTLSDNMAIGSETAEIYFDLNGHSITEGTYYISIIGSKKVHLGNKYGNAQSVIQGTGTYSITLQDGTSPYLVFDDGTDLGGEVCIYNQGGTTSVRALRVFNSAHNAVCEVRNSNLRVIATVSGYAATTNWGHLIVSGDAEFYSNSRYAIYLSTGGKCTISNGRYFSSSSNYSPLYFYTAGSGDQELRITGGRFYTNGNSNGCIGGGTASIYGPFIKELSGGWFGNGAGGTALNSTVQAKITSGYSYQYDATGTTIRVHTAPNSQTPSKTLNYKVDITS